MSAEIWPDAYGAVKSLHHGAWGDVVAAIRLSDEHPVVLKIFNANERGMEHARRELASLRAISHPGIPEAIALELSCERPCLVLEQLPGIPLKSWIQSQGLPSIQRVLELAIQWAEILAAVHAARLVHRDITPNNLLVDPSSQRTFLVDFGLATQLGGTISGAVGEALSSGLAGTLPFMAPEQTGRMNRGFGFRSDLYALGATLYFALTGKPPFQLTDALELIHAHIARQPVSPTELRAEVPEILSRLVLKLLAKEPEDRYASAKSLRSDLVSLLEQLQSQGRLDPAFALEAIEIPDRPRFASKLYGREAQTEALWESLTRAIASGPRVVCIRGASGSGKTALVDSLRARLGEVGAYLVQAGFDPRHERPYAQWLGCLESLSQQLLVESDTRLKQWCAQLREGLGPVAGALSALVPDLAVVLGDVPAVPPLGSAETRARLLLAMQRFLTAFSRPEHPLVLFFDDLGHSDSGSRFLLQELFSADCSGSLLVVLACRDEDLEAGSPVSAVLSRIEQLGVPIDSIPLAPLALDAVLELLEDTLAKPRAVIAPLAAHVERKTGCNPLWVRQFIEHLHGQGLLSYVPGEGWQWDLAALAGASVPDGAIGLLIAKLDNLPPSQRDILSRASCAGQVFDAALLQQLVDAASASLPHTALQSASLQAASLQSTSLQEGLLELETLGLILPCPGGFRFTHERIRDAAQAHLTLEERRALHARVSAALLQRTPVEERTAHIFEIADQLMRAEDALPAELRITRIELCLAAGREALRSGAAEEARRYLERGRRDVGPAEWTAQHALCLGTWLSCAEAAFHTEDMSGALALLEEAEPHLATDLERAQLEMQRIQVLVLSRTPEESVRYALKALRHWGVRWPLRPSRLRTAFTMYRHFRFVRARAQQGVRAPAGELDARRRAVLMLINAAGGTMSRVDCKLAALATCYVVSQPMPAALSSREAYSAGNFALWLQLIFDDSKRASQIAEGVQAWIARTGDAAYAARVDVTLRACLYSWMMRRRRATAALDSAAETMREHGDVEYAYYARFLKSVYSAFAGDAVPTAHARFHTLAETVRKAGHAYPEPERCLVPFRWLLEPDLDLATLDVDRAESAAYRRADPGGVHVMECTLWTLVLCVYGRHDLVLEEARVFEASLFRTVPYVHVAHYMLYRGIAAAHLASGRRRRGALIRSLKAATRRLHRWATAGPDFAHMELLLRAEQARLRRKTELAHSLYEQAARGALTQEFVHHAAIAKERRALLLLESRRLTEAREVLKQALQLYERWGAMPKVAQLRAEYEALLES